MRRSYPQIGRTGMSRLCRLKTASHGDDGQWAYNEIVSLRKQRDELNRLCEFNEKTMQFLLDVINHIVDEAKLTSSQYELCRQAIASVKELK